MKQQFLTSKSHNALRLLKFEEERKNATVKQQHEKSHASSDNQLISVVFPRQHFSNFPLMFKYLFLYFL